MAVVVWAGVALAGAYAFCYAFCFWLPSPVTWWLMMLFIEGCGEPLKDWEPEDSP
jgi:hypothetical protein